MAGNYHKPTDRRLTAQGLSKTPEYNILRHMIRRCDNPKDHDYKNYGGRGITVCQRWRESYVWFLIDVGPRPGPKYSIDRYPDNDGNYEPGNVRWATTAQQNRNARRNRKVTINGETKLLLEWAELSGVGWTTLFWRLKKGCPAEQLLRPANPHESFLTFEGRTMSQRNWAKATGLNERLICKRLLRGWTVEQALSTPSLAAGKRLSQTHP